MYEYGVYARHHANLSWISDTGIIDRKSNIRYWKFKQICRSEKIMNYLEKNNYNKLSKIYVFLVYDFLDYGSIHFLSKGLKKIIRKA